MARGPWSVKGIDSRARERARENASRDGLTLGQYLNRLLMEDMKEPAGPPTGTLTEERPNTHRQDRSVAGDVMMDDYQDMANEVEALAARLRETARHSRLPHGEGRDRHGRSLTSDFSEPHQHRDYIGSTSGLREHSPGSIREVLARLASSEQNQADLSHHVQSLARDLELAQSRLQERLDTVSRSSSNTRELEGMRALEGALSRLTRELYDSQQKLQGEQARLRTDVESDLLKVNTDVTSLGQRMDSSLTDAMAKMEGAVKQVESRTRDSEKALNEGLDSLSKARKDVDAASERAEIALETSRTIGREFGGRLDSLERSSAAARDASLAAEQRHKELHSNIHALARLTDEKLEQAVSIADDALDKASNSRSQLEARIGEVAARTSEAITSANEAAHALFEKLEARSEERLRESRESADSALSEKLQELEEQNKTQLDEVVTRTTEAILSARRETDSLLHRINSHDEYRDGLDERLQQILDTTARALKTAHTEGRSLADRLDKIEAARESKFEDLLKRSEDALAEAQNNSKGLADKLFSRVETVEEQLQSGQTNIATLMGRISDLSSKVDNKDADTEALNTLQSAMERINDRLETAEKKSEGAIQTLTRSFNAFGDRLEAVEKQADEGTDLRETFQKKIDYISATLNETVEATRHDLTQQIAKSVQDVPTPDTVEALEKRIETLQKTINDSQAQQSEAVLVMSSQFERMSKVLDDRLRKLESSGGEALLEDMRVDLDRLTFDFQDRISALEAGGDTSLNKVAQEIATVADQMEQRIRDTEKRSAEAIEQIGEHVVRAAERVQAQGEASRQELIERVENLDQTNQNRLDEALENFNQRLEKLDATAMASVTPLQNTVASLARRVDSIEDQETDPDSEEVLPPIAPIAVGADTLKPPEDESDLSLNSLSDEDIDEDLDPLDDDMVDDDLEQELSGIEDELNSSLDALGSDTDDDNDDELDTASISALADDARREFAAHLANERELGFHENTPPDDTQNALEGDIFGDLEEVAPPPFEDDMPSAFGTASSLKTDIPSTPAIEYEAELPPVRDDDALPDALRSDRGIDDDPFARASVNNLDFLSDARRAALERGDQNRGSFVEYPSDDPRPRRNNAVPIMAASALAIAVAGGGFMMMRGKQANQDDFNAVPPNSDPVAPMTPGDNASLDDDLFDEQQTENTLFGEATSDFMIQDAAIDEEILFPEEAEIITAEALQDDSSNDVVVMSADLQTLPETAPSAAVTTGPRRASAVEAFGGDAARNASASRSTQPPPAPAAVTLESAAAAGDPIALYDLALKNLASGNKRSAAETMQQAAEKGLPIAQYRMAKFYERGEGVPRSISEARSWTDKAARGGNVKAMHDLAVFYAEGDGGQQSYVGAVEWFTKAANHNLVDSQYNVGVLYEQGLGVTRNLAEAALWFEIAGRNGDADAARRGRALVNELPTVDASAVNRRADNFRPSATNNEANGVFASKPWETSTTDQINEAQRLLNLLGYSAGEPDGVMGARTRAAIRSFEAASNLSPTGNVTPGLLEMLRSRSIAG